ncbi:MAG: hypothetical protein ACKV0T_30210 [Planctomycetales bacterium]
MAMAVGNRQKQCVARVGALFVAALWLSSQAPAQETVQPDLGYRAASIAPGGSYVYVSGKWGIIQVTLTNRTDQPVEMLAATYFEGEATLQYGRRTWIPPRARIRTWHPVRLPKEAGPGGKTFPFRTLVMHGGDKQEVLIKSDQGSMQFDGSLRVMEARTVSGMIDALDAPLDEEIEAAAELMLAARVGEQLGRQIAYLVDPIFAPGDETLSGLDQLVIAHSRVADDLAAIRAIRRWLFGGGHLWIMLDRVDPRVLEMLLGDDIECQVVDQVGLTSFQVEPTASGTKASWPAQEHELPVNLVRVIVSEVDVPYTVNGWPAAFTRPCGEGRLLVTTLGPRGWMRRRTPEDRALPPPLPQNPVNAPPPQQGQQENATAPSSNPPGQGTGGEGAQSTRPPGSAPGGMEEVLGNLADAAVPDPGRFIPLDPMKLLAADLFSSRPEPLVPEDILEPQVQEYVGYSVPPRWLIVSLLIGFTSVLALAGIGLWRAQRLEWLGAIGPALAVIVGGVLIVLGRQHQEASTVASMQVVTAVAGSNEVILEGVTGLYSPEAEPTTIAGRRGGRMIPDMSGQEGTTRRMIWSDMDAWRWENLPSATGLRSGRFSGSIDTRQRLEATATFGPDGLTGKLEVGDANHPADPILVTRAGRMGVTLRDDGSFVSNMTDVFSAEQYLSAALLSDEQNRRQKILQHMLPQPRFEDEEDEPKRGEKRRVPRYDYPAQPQLLFWSDAWEAGFEYDANRRKLGAALVTVPLRLARPETGTAVAIPSPFLPYRQSVGPDGMQPSGLWDFRKRAWSKKAVASSTWLRFQIPQVLLPLEIRSGRVVVQVRGPVGKLEISGHRGDQIVPIKTWIDPVGTLSFDLTDAELLQLSADGGLLLRVAAGDDNRPELTTTKTDSGVRYNYWRIESLALDLQALTVDPPPSERASDRR